jgi:TPR repeat protein
MKTICIITALTALLACVAHGQRNDQQSKANITQLRTDADKGDTTAQYLLGMRYAKGEGVTLD